MCDLCAATGRYQDFPYVSGFSCDDDSTGQDGSSLGFAGGMSDPGLSGFTPVSSSNVAYTGFHGTATATQLPVFTNDQIAEQLTDGYWNELGSSRRSFDVRAGDEVTADLTGLTDEGQALARSALNAWTIVSGLKFSFVSSGADITFDDEDSGPYVTSSASGGTILSSFVNVPASMLSDDGNAIPGFTYFTYLQKIGQALGLGLAGNYDNSATYRVDNHYANDSWQSSVMSSFSQTANTSVDASFAYPMTPMIADIIAIQDLYGVPDNSYPDFTMYGTNPGGYPSPAFVEIPSNAAVTIFDTGGSDLFNFIGNSVFDGITADQWIDLRPESISSVAGGSGNLLIARGTIIERAYGGQGDDTLIGNDAGNHLVGYEGDDTLIGGKGDDVLSGWAGRDTVWAGPGDDHVRYDDDDLFWTDGVPRDVGGEGIDKLIITAGSKFNTAGLSLYGFEQFQGAELDDRVEGNDGSVDYWMHGGGGDDFLQGNAGNDTLLGGDGHDILHGGAGDDLLRGGIWGHDELRGEEGNDTIYYSSGDVFWDRHRPINIGGPGIDKLIIEEGSKFNTVALSRYGFEQFQGAEKDDRVIGNDPEVDYWMHGGGGRDNLQSSAGNDMLFGGDGADSLLAGAGDDILAPGPSSFGSQTCQGDFGDDTYLISSDCGHTIIREFDGRGTDTVIFQDLKPSDIEASVGYADHLLLSWGDDGNEVSFNDLGIYIESFEFFDGTILQVDDFDLI
ncbi:M10 family metallopeptidase C-terminal domain-containing protein [Roseibium sp. FZY0029]|uniref:M10 family metallopeptidase C-terminal domain-containing protein n=1 Tax=Roseibium sp. FZY0029 TaxID=3116647 RepID=UPI002EA9D61D|nr:M10 family metallopeptidase C-terminal domain-containing protein [Roseibium sp. FZY0029]